MIKNYFKAISLILVSTIFAGCSDEPSGESSGEGDDVGTTAKRESLIICNEGNWQSDNGQLSYYDAESGDMINQWFRKVNGMKLGDTPNDIILVNDNLIAIAVNWSNIIQYISPDGKNLGATENVPNNRRLCTDGKYLYVTSYAHRCGDKEFQKGFVAKIEVSSGKVVATCGVGWEPEGIAIYDGRLYVANSGGYSFSESHEYETTVDVVDAETMTSLRTIDTGCLNLYGKISQAGKYLCINSGGDYYGVAPSTIILDCESEEFRILDFPSTYSASDGRYFYTIGSHFSYITGEYIYSINTIDPKTGEVTPGIFNETITDKIKELTSPYSLYISPYTGNVYFTDAGSYASAGYVYGYTKEGEEVFSPKKVYINPGQILAIKNTNYK